MALNWREPTCALSQSCHRHRHLVQFLRDFLVFSGEIPVKSTGGWLLTAESVRPNRSSRFVTSARLGRISERVYIERAKNPRAIDCRRTAANAAQGVSQSAARAEQPFHDSHFHDLSLSVSVLLSYLIRCASTQHPRIRSVPLMNASRQAARRIFPLVVFKLAPDASSTTVRTGTSWCAATAPRIARTASSAS